MPGYTELREQTLALFPGLADIARRSGAVATLDRLASAERRLREGTLQVVVCGEFKRGKSSLINGLLGEVELLPESASIATSVVTTVGYRAKERIVVRVAGRDDAPEEREISRDELPAYVTERGNPHNDKGVQSVAIEIPNERLKPGLVLVDTPGIGGVHTPHLLATEAVVDRANVIVFVTDTTQRLSENEQQFLREAAETAKLLDEEDALLFVLTKIDRLADEGEFLASTRAMLAASLGRPAQEVKIIQVSSKARKKYLRTASAAQRDRSNFGELEEVIWAALARRQARMLLCGALLDLEDCAAALLKPIDDQIAGLDSPAVSKALKDTVEARFRHLDQMAAPKAPWRADLAAGVAKIERDVKVGTLKEAESDWKQMAAELAGLLDKPGEIDDRVARNLLRIVSVADRMLHEAGDALLRELTERYGLEPGHTEMARLPAPTVPDIQVRAAMPKPQQQSLRRYAGFLSISQTGGLALGRLLDALLGVQGPGERLGGPVGGVVGAALAGSIILTRRLQTSLAQRKDNRERTADAEAELKRISGEVARWIARMVSEASRLFGDEIGTEIESRIRQERASAEESLRRVAEGGAPDSASVAALRKELEAERLPLVRARQRIAELARAVLELASRGRGPRA